MSRHTEIINGNEIVWGKDHACGYFIQVFDLAADKDTDPIVNLDSVFDSIDADKVIMIAEVYGVDPVHVSAMLDRDI